VGIERDASPYGSQTVMGPGWPNVEEEQLASAAAEYTQFATKLTGSVVPLQQSQLQALAAQWMGAGSVAAAGEATSIIAGHEANAAHAAAIALKLQTMEVSVAKTKALVNATAEEVQQECMALQAASALVSNTEELIQSRIKMGLSQNIAYVSEGAAEVANGLGVPPSMPSPGAPPGTAQGEQAAGNGSQEAMQMMMQMGQMAMQLPQQLGQMVMQAPQQLMEQVSQPLQQLTSMFGGKGGSGGGLGGASPFAAFLQPSLGRWLGGGRRRGDGPCGVLARRRRHRGADAADGQLGRQPTRQRRGRDVRCQQQGGRWCGTGGGRCGHGRRYGHDGRSRARSGERWHRFVAGASAAPRVRPDRR
jgi:hypothetical protein